MNASGKNRKLIRLHRERGDTANKARAKKNLFLETGWYHPNRVPVTKKGFLIGEDMEKEPQPKFTIEEMHSSDVGEANAMRLESWLDTYVNDELGVTLDWIAARNAVQSSPEQKAARLDRFMQNKADGTMNAWVARDSSGNIVGSTTPYVNKNGVQHVGSLYVEKSWHGSGVASELMQKVIDWFDPAKNIELGVVAYNERAKAFYRKWGFVEVPDSEQMLEDKIPEVKMVRKGGEL